MMQRLLEICVETAQGCVAAKEGGADRVELCSGLIVGGLTPSHGLIREAAGSGSLPVYVLLRPRAGDFLYFDEEFRMMCTDLEHAAMLGASGFVAGILREDGMPDVARMTTLVQLAGGKEVTFHRAFDCAARRSESLEMVIDSGCRRLLTSGGAPTAMRGIDELATLKAQAGERIRIAAGGSVDLSTAEAVLRVASVDIHASLRAGKTWGLGNGDPLWDDAAMPVWISPDDVREFAELVRRT